MEQEHRGQWGHAALGDTAIDLKRRTVIIERLAREHSVPEDEARVYFDEMLRFLDLAYTTGEPLTPSKVIDDSWHTFMLFSREYTRYCEDRFGRYMHHEPDDGGGGGSGPGYEGTRELAESTFGSLDERAWPKATNAACASASAECASAGNCTSDCKSGASCASEGNCTSECRSSVSA